ncbi:MAG: bifunctional diguanylate cyclase/phosphodiesterase [Colwellia sp.]|nr:bifunctional diguanylate cyclase/phosphodiesterase [Colwellia sp.]
MDLFIIIIIVGTLFLIASLRPTFNICRKEDNIAWCFLFCSIVLFIVGYLGIIYYFFSFEFDPLVVSIISCILFGGGIFVFLVIKLSYKSILKIESAVEVQRHLAEHDILTNLPNRKMFFKSLSLCVEKETPCSVFFIDLNNFKQINDSFGHHFGDQLLIATAQKLVEGLHSFSHLFRVGGDEFAIHCIHNDESDFNDCASLIEKLREVPLLIEQQRINMNLSAGVSHFPKDSQKVDQLVKHADIAMYDAKKNKKQLVYYTTELGEKHQETILMSNSITKAIEENEFQLYFQPIFSANNSELHGVESLIRWPQPDGSFISPDKFIPIAEQTNLILSLTKWVILEALKNLQKLKIAGFTGVLHINLSAQDLRSTEFYEYIMEFYREDPSIANDIVFEITESSMMTNINRVKEMITALNSKGFQFSVDDFGTGFSSLSLLRELPIQEIKIDCSFVNSMLTKKADFAIVKSIIFLANQLNCHVVAEGIEDGATEASLIQLNCDYLQGFYYSKPISLAAFEHEYLINGKNHLH